MASDTTDRIPGVGCLKIAGFLGGLYLIPNFVIYFFSAYPLAAWGVPISAGLLLGGGIVGGFVGASSIGVIARRRIRIAAPVLLIFGAACLLAVLGMTMRPPEFQFEGSAPAEGGTIGPIEVPRENMRVDLQARQPIREGSGRYQRWSFVTVELLGANKEYLSSFGGDLWHYAGDPVDELDWEQSEEVAETMLEFPSAGTYYIRIQTEANVPTKELSSVSVKMDERGWWGNPVPVRVASFVAFFLGGLLIVVPRMGHSERVLQQLEDGGHVRYEGHIWRVGDEKQYTYPDWKATEWALQPTDPGTKTPRYLEREYEEDSDWENWFLSRPVPLDELTCTGPEGTEMTVQRYAAEQEEVPDAVTVAETRYELDEVDTVRPKDEYASVRYHDYEGPAGQFVTIEGIPGGALDAVMGASISLSDLSIVDEKAT